MSDAEGEALSALFDNEGTDFDIRRVLKSEIDGERWQRWQQQRQSLAGHAPDGFQAINISDRVRAALIDEPAPRQTRIEQWLKPMSGFAVAAAVAGLVVFGLGGPTATTGLNSPGLVDSRVYPAPASRDGGALTAGVRAGVLPEKRLENTEQQRRFERYVRSHSERSMDNSGQGMLSYARSAAWKAEY